MEPNDLSQFGRGLTRVLLHCVVMAMGAQITMANAADLTPHDLILLDRLTFGISGRAGAARHQVKGLIAFGIGLALTSGALAGLHASVARPGRLADVGVLIGANLVATAARFLLFRRWVFGPGQASASRRSGSGNPPAIQCTQPVSTQPVSTQPVSTQASVAPAREMTR